MKIKDIEEALKAAGMSQIEIHAVTACVKHVQKEITEDYGRRSFTEQYGLITSNIIKTA